MDDEEVILRYHQVAVCILAVALVSFAVLTKETFFSSREMFKHPVILGMYMLVPPNAIMVVGYMIEHSYELYYGVVATAGPGCTLIAFIACAAITAIMGGSVVVAFATERMISSKSRAKTKHIMMGNAISWALGFMTSLKFLVDGSLGPYQKMYCCIKDEAFSDTAPFVTLLFLTGSMCAQIFFYKRANCIIRNQDAHRQELLALGGASAPRTLSYQDTGRAPGEGTALVGAQAQGGGGGGAGGAPSLPSALAGADPERAARRRRDRELEAAKTSSRQLAQWGLEMAAVFGALWALMFLNAALRSYSVLTWLYLDVGAAWLVKVSPTAICVLLLVRIRAFKKVGFRDAVVTRGGARPGGGKGAGGHPSLFQGSPLEFTKVDSLAKLDQLREKKRQLKGRLAGAEGAEGRALRGGGGDFGAEYVRPARARGYSQQDYVISAIELA